MLILKAEGVVGQTSEEVCHDIVQLAKKTETIIELEFNGIWMYAKPSDDPVEIWNRLQSALKDGRRAI